METPLLEFRRVRLSFDGQRILTDLDFQLADKQSFALLGPSGAGKTVFVKTALGLFTPDSGDVLFEGKSIREPEVLARLRDSAAMAFQKSGLFDSLRCGENLDFVLRQRTKLSPKERAVRVEAALESVALGGQGDLKIPEMSGGMLKRLGVARALLLSPRLVFFDEPTAGLDPVTARSIDALLVEAVKRAGAALVAVCSEPVEAYGICDWIGYLNHGRFLAIGREHQMRKTEQPEVRQFLYGLAEGPLTEEF